MRSRVHGHTEEAGKVAGTDNARYPKKWIRGAILRYIGRIFALICVMELRYPGGIPALPPFSAIYKTRDSASRYWYIQLKSGMLCSAIDEDDD